MRGGECIVLAILIGLEKGLTLSLEQTGHRIYLHNLSYALCGPGGFYIFFHCAMGCHDDGHGRPTCAPCVLHSPDYGYERSPSTLETQLELNWAPGSAAITNV